MRRPAQGERGARARGGRAVSAARPPLSAGSRLAYCFFRLPLSSLDFTFRPARQVIWVDTLGQTLSSQASLISAVKSLDLLLGFTVGKASDNTRTRWGRRKPFLLLGSVVMAIGAALLCSPPSALKEAVLPPVHVHMDVCMMSMVHAMRAGPGGSLGYMD